MIELYFGHTRHVYNWALEQKINHYKETGTSLSKKILQENLVKMKKAEKPWLKDVNSQSLLAALFNLENAYINFFKKRSAFPHFKRKYDGHQSYQCPQHVTVDFENKHLDLPKIKEIKARIHRDFSGQIKTVTVSRTPTNKYFVSILVEDANTIPVKSSIEADKTLGIDLGLMHYLITDQGQKENHPTYLRQNLSRLKKKQRGFSRKINYSNNRTQEKVKLAKLHEKIGNQRKDFVQKLSAKLAFNNHETRI